MKATINIQEDEELRSSVKEMLRGQVKSIVRDDVKAIAKKEAELKIPAFFNDKRELRQLAREVITSEEFYTMAREAVSELTNDYIKSVIEGRVFSILNGDIRKQAREAINKEIADNMPKINLSVDRK